MNDELQRIKKKRDESWNIPFVAKEGRDHQDNSIIKFDQNTGKSPGKLSRLAVTQTSVRNN